MREGLTDAWAAGGGDPAASPTLAGNPVDGLDPSDHLAVVCDLS